ncbi:MAG: hypothetical protein A3E40_00140 [Candidatus Levybacteria bacterium RIFCSPHIGHO2_12_FULL_37_9]|nr:MAG: hypothetical protein A3E40_00140 [Candidatus Levybacteria bacterium RIFCSPHIGHO2_12_FULL_37_9]
MLKIGIIGSGFGLYGLLPAFYSLKNCSVIAVCANNPERLSKYYYSLGLKNVYSDWRKMLEKENLEAIAIAVTPDAQYEIAKAAIQKGIHVFAEKPLADTYERAKTLYDLAVKYKVTHAVDFVFPEIDEWIRVKQLLENNKYGKLNHISVNWDFLSYDIKHGLSSWKTDALRGGGALSFYFSHSLYYLEYFAGEIEDVKSTFSHSEKSLNGAEVGVNLLLRFKNNIYGSAHISCNTIGLNRHQLIFRCERGTIQLANRNSLVRNFQITIYTENGEKSINTHKKTAKDDEKARVDVIKKIAERFVSACIHKQQMKPSMKEGVRVQQLIKIIKTTLP